MRTGRKIEQTLSYKFMCTSYSLIHKFSQSTVNQSVDNLYSMLVTILEDATLKQTDRIDWIFQNDTCLQSY